MEYIIVWVILSITLCGIATLCTWIGDKITQRITYKQALKKRLRALSKEK